MRTHSALILCLVSIGLFPYCGSSRKATSSGSEIIMSGENSAPAATAPVISKTAPPPGIDTATFIRQKYAVHLHTTPQSLTNIRLYLFIDEWINTPYLWGGMDKKGIDCSAFMQKLYDEVYNIYIPRTSVQQFFAKWVDRFSSSASLSEGDLVFFKTIKGNPITHVGFYLGNRMFVNSSSSKGVSLGNLDDPYWATKYVGAGRIKQKMVTKIRP